MLLFYLVNCLVLGSLVDSFPQVLPASITRLSPDTNLRNSKLLLILLIKMVNFRNYIEFEYIKVNLIDAYCFNRPD